MLYEWDALKFLSWHSKRKVIRGIYGRIAERIAMEDIFSKGSKGKKEL
jgi:hypothetical protein